MVPNTDKIPLAGPEEDLYFQTAATLFLQEEYELWLTSLQLSADLDTESKAEVIKWLVEHRYWNGPLLMVLL